MWRVRLRRGTEDLLAHVRAPGRDCGCRFAVMVGTGGDHPDLLHQLVGGVSQRLVLAQLLEHAGFKVRYHAVLEGIADLDRMAAHFAVLDVSLAVYGGIENHRDLLPAVGAGEKVLHDFSVQVSGVEQDCRGLKKGQSSLSPFSRHDLQEMQDSDERAERAHLPQEEKMEVSQCNCVRMQEPKSTRAKVPVRS